MMGGGIPEGDSVLVTGASGTGKSVLATQFIAEGIRQGEPGIVAVFEERPQAYTDRAGSSEHSSFQGTTCSISSKNSARRVFFEYR
jgi:KaiC/GvpD/RAD55 family RecA-like ATPase